MVIASESLKFLSLEQFDEIFDIEISCPNLEELLLCGCLHVRIAKLLDLPSSLCATIDFNHNEDVCNKHRRSLIKDVLNQLRHVKKLTIGDWFVKVTSKVKNMTAVQAGSDQFSPVFNIKCLILKSYNTSVIEWLLRNSPVLEELVIDAATADLKYDEAFGENYWSSVTVFNCLLLSHLKTIKIIIGSLRRDENRKHMLKFIQFFIKNAIVLEKMVVYLKNDGIDFLLKVSLEFLVFSRIDYLAKMFSKCHF